MIGGVLTTIIWKSVYPDSTIYPVLPGFMVSVVGYIVFSLSTKPPPEKAWKPYFEKETSPKNIE